MHTTFFEVVNVGVEGFNGPVERFYILYMYDKLRQDSLKPITSLSLIPALC